MTVDLEVSAFLAPRAAQGITVKVNDRTIGRLELGREWG